MHPLLERQLRRHLGVTSEVPPELRAFCDAVSHAYEQADEDRRNLERSLESSANELTERVQSLQHERSDHEVIFNAAPAMIFFKDSENRILRVNALGAQAMAAPIKDLEGRSTYDLMPHDIAKKLHDDDLDVIRTGKPKLGVIESHPDVAGVDHWIRTDKVPYVRDGKVVGVVVFSQDISEQKRAEEGIKEYNRQLESLVKFRTQFFNTTAHELRTPLTPIMLQAHLLQQALAPLANKDQRHGFEILSRNIARLDALVRDVLDAARLQSGRLPLRMQDHDLLDVVRHGVESVAPQARECEVSIEATFEGALRVHGDPTRLGQVVSNLLSNALKFTPKRGKVTVLCRKIEQEHALVEVHDTGIGIEPSAIGKLFEPFSQVHDPMKANVSGTGLGLYVSRGIIEQHGGRIWCDSQGIDRGATFRFTIPLLPTPLAPHQSSPARAEAAAAGA